MNKPNRRQRNTKKRSTKPIPQVPHQIPEIGQPWKLRELITPLISLISILVHWFKK
jgi:hypothetical protein